MPLSYNPKIAWPDAYKIAWPDAHKIAWPDEFGVMGDGLDYTSSQLAKLRIAQLEVEKLQLKKTKDIIDQQIESIGKHIEMLETEFQESE